MNAGVDAAAHDHHKAICRAPAQELLVSKARIANDGVHNIRLLRPFQALQQLQRQLAGRAILLCGAALLLPIEPEAQRQAEGP